MPERQIPNLIITQRRKFFQRISAREIAARPCFFGMMEAGESGFEENHISFFAILRARLSRLSSSASVWFTRWRMREMPS